MQSVLKGLKIMKVGDLVEVKFRKEFFSGFEHNMMTKEPVNQVGIVVEMAENACKVMFSNRNNEIRNFMKSSLEVVSSK